MLCGLTAPTEFPCPAPFMRYLLRKCKNPFGSRLKLRLHGFPSL